MKQKKLSRRPSYRQLAAQVHELTERLARLQEIDRGLRIEMEHQMVRFRVEVGQAEGRGALKALEEIRHARRESATQQLARCQ